MPKRFSTARAREFGDGVRNAISATGLTARELCEKIGWDPGKLSDLLNGKGGCSETDLAILLSYCRIAPKERDHLLEIFRQTDVSFWWQNYSENQPFRLRTFMEHLWKAKDLVAWQPILIPGLLQIPEYTRAVCLESANLPRDEIEDRMALRVAMQEVFRQRLNCTFFIHENALQLPVGGYDVMRAQLHHLLMMLVRPYIDLRIVPVSVGAHAGLAGSFELMRFDRIEPVVFLEAENSILVVEGKTPIGEYETIIKNLDRNALDVSDSQMLISKYAT